MELYIPNEGRNAQIANWRLVAPVFGLNITLLRDGSWHWPAAIYANHKWFAIVFETKLFNELIVFGETGKIIARFPLFAEYMGEIPWWAWEGIDLSVTALRDGKIEIDLAGDGLYMHGVF